MSPVGLVLLNKPPGITSFRALGPVKRILGTKKIGHTGTLDQFAQGLIICLVGSFTKLNSHLMDLSKTYLAEIYFGPGTDTLDPTGEVTSEGRIPALSEIEAVLPGFLGHIQQVPPNFSALKVQGKRASDRVRAGEEVQLEARFVTIHAIEVLDFSTPKLTLRIECSKGTYIRSLARDLASSLGTYAHLTRLERTAQGQFDLSLAKTPEELSPEDLMHPRDFAQLWGNISCHDISNAEAQALENGQYPELPISEKPLMALFDRENRLRAMAQRVEGSWRNLFVVPKSNI